MNHNDRTPREKVSCFPYAASEGLPFGPETSGSMENPLHNQAQGPLYGLPLELQEQPSTLLLYRPQPVLASSGQGLSPSLLASTNLCARLLMWSLGAMGAHFLVVPGLQFNPGYHIRAR